LPQYKTSQTDRQQTDRRHSVPKARPIVRSAKNHNCELITSVPENDLSHSCLRKYFSVITSPAFLVCVVELSLEVGEVNDVMNKLDVADTPVTPKYDDPYAENPIAAKCLCTGVKESGSGVAAATVVTDSETAATLTQETSCCLPAAPTEQKSECVSESGCVVTPVRSFELSAEYGGFFVPEPSINKQAEEHQQPAAEDVRPIPPRASIMQATRAESSISGAGFYDEPWDLSTVTRNIQEQLCETSQKDVGRAAVDNCRPTTADVYAQPHRGEKRHHRLAGVNAADPRVTDGPSYGVLCERISDNGFMPAPPPLARRKAGTRGCQPGTWTTDSRPLDDYDVPWDQKKKPADRTSKKLILLYEL